MREIEQASCAPWKSSAIILAILEGRTGRIDGRTGVPARTPTWICSSVPNTPANSAYCKRTPGPR